jgi:hypothetical protein
MHEDGSGSSGHDNTSEDEVSPFHSDSPDLLAGGDDDITWMSSADMERVGKIAYA